MIRPSRIIQLVNILSVILPEAHAANEVFAALRERDVITARALVTWCRVCGLIPNWCVGGHGACTCGLTPGSSSGAKRRQLHAVVRHQLIEWNPIRLPSESLASA